MKEVTLSEVLEARERRAEAQKRLLAQHSLPLISFTMNIPGPVKDSPVIRRAFEEGLKQLEEALKAKKIPVLSPGTVRAATGCEYLCAADTDAGTLKTLCEAIEDGSPMGRLFDMDVIAADGRKLDRAQERRCLVCGASGRSCASRRLHSLEELGCAVNRLLREGLLAADAERVDSLATKALLDEVETTPKPGLVDRNNCGSHLDMTTDTFRLSAEALSGYWGACFRAGAETAAQKAQEAFADLRALGLEAENRMFEATGGVNTHKGAVFTLGTVCGAAGRCWKPEAPFAEPEEIASVCRELSGPSVSEEFAELRKGGVPKTSGERIYLEHGLKGIRGEVSAGLPAVLETALPVLESLLSDGLSRNDAGALTLLHLVARGEDTNMVKRGGAALAAAAADELRCFLQKNPRPGMKWMEELDSRFIFQGLSPGGCADLLAVSYFLHDLKAEQTAGVTAGQRPHTR